MKVVGLDSLRDLRCREEDLGLHGKGAAGGGEVVFCLQPHPEIGVAPTYALQGQCHAGRDFTMPIQQARNGVAAHSQPIGELLGGPSDLCQWVFQDLSRMDWISLSHGLSFPASGSLPGSRSTAWPSREPEGNSPIAAYPNAPECPRLLPLRGMQSVPRHIQIVGLCGFIQDSKDAVNPGDVFGIQSTGVVTLPESP